MPFHSRWSLDGLRRERTDRFLSGKLRWRSAMGRCKWGTAFPFALFRVRQPGLRLVGQLGDEAGAMMQPDKGGPPSEDRHQILLRNHGILATFP